jgi:DNA topoisomerase-1
MDDIALDEALALFKLPRHLGETSLGQPIQVSIGRFGPYLKYGNKFVSLKVEDPYTIDLERALELIEEKQQLDASRIIREFNGSDLRVLHGRYGPYVTDGAKNVRIPKDKEPAELSLDECQKLIKRAPAKRSNRPQTKRSMSG